MEDVAKLPEEHLERAKEIISKHRTKKDCNKCYNRGYQGVNQLNLAITCFKCVDEDKVIEEWQAYVRDTPALVEMYGDYFESDEQEETGEEEQKHASVEKPVRKVAQDRGRQHGGSATPHRSVGR